MVLIVGEGMLVGDGQELPVVVVDPRHLQAVEDRFHQVGGVVNIETLSPVPPEGGHHGFQVPCQQWWIETQLVEERRDFERECVAGVGAELHGWLDLEVERKDRHSLSHVTNPLYALMVSCRALA